LSDAHLIAERGQELGVDVSVALADRLSAYLRLLRLWNRRINLTSVPIDPLSPDAIDRILLEPLAAAQWIRDSDRLLLDVGSGGGSPAIPLILSSQRLRGVLVEVRTKKAAFLREVLRELEMSDTSVIADKLQNLSLIQVGAPADVVTFRAVRVDDALVKAARALSRSGTNWLVFGDVLSEPHQIPTGLQSVKRVENLLRTGRTGLTIASVS